MASTDAEVQTDSQVQTDRDADEVQTEKTYKEKAHDQYKDLLEEFVFRSHRAALMNYRISSEHDKESQFWEYLAFPVGSGVIASVPTYFMENGLSSFAWYLIFLGYLVANLLAKKGMDFYLSKTHRANSHTKAAAGWQRLEQRAQSYLIQLDLENPQLDPEKMSEWYEDLVKDKEEVCKHAVIPESSHKNYNAETVYEDIKWRKQEFEKYKQLISANKEVAVRTDDHEDKTCKIVAVVCITILVIIICSLYQQFLNFF